MHKGRDAMPAKTVHEPSGCIVVTAAVDNELSLLVRELNAVRLEGAGLRPVWKGESPSGTVYLAATGIGKVNAAVTATLLTERFRPKLLVNTGCGGAYWGSGLSVGDLAVATAEIYGDEGVLTVDGWHTLEIIGIPSVERNGNRYSNEFPLSMLASEKVFHFAFSLGLPVKRGKFITVSTCSGTSSRGSELYRRFGGICENMEGAAVAHVALLYDTPFLEVRGISNMVEDRDLSRWDIPRSVEMAQRFLFRCLERRLF
ncbi:MAG: purine or other phosphorylase, family 1 [Deltaproteobacteria bacterium]|nr:purine or other phosphorylase, family 1 [Deltaproteobacteria bacterium]